MFKKAGIMNTGNRVTGLMMEEVLLRVLVRYLVFLDDFEDVTISLHDIVRQHEELTVILSAMNEEQKQEFLRKMSSVVEVLNGHEREVMNDFIEGLDLFDEQV